MFDQATLREELVALQSRLEADPRNAKLVNLYVKYARQLREQDQDHEARNSMTGY